MTDTEKLYQTLRSADAVVVGAGAGLSTAAGFTYSGERFQKHFADFIGKYGFTDMYTAGFYNFPTQEEFWAYWSRHIYFNRYVPSPKPVYDNLLKLLKDKDYFVITTNVDHQFQRAGFDKQRLFYTQGDYGLLQCATPCHQKTYDNEEIIKKMIAAQQGEASLQIPTELIPKCPVCGGKMTVNLRSDSTFVEDEGWHAAAQRYLNFVNSHSHGKILYWDLGIGANTPTIIKLPFMQMTLKNPEAVYATINLGEAFTVEQIKDRSIVIDADIAVVLEEMLKL
ncbi:MAG: Sir2 silent information regulator family NAD-dependent deacetylase [Muribaculaceae bacterium]|nr:Sir2 silent information regulator family NAD-dependent deacetylase [Muribaculaceae bacterium]